MGKRKKNRAPDWLREDFEQGQSNTFDNFGGQGDWQNGNGGWDAPYGSGSGSGKRRSRRKAGWIVPVCIAAVVVAVAAVAGIFLLNRSKGQNTGDVSVSVTESNNGGSSIFDKGPTLVSKPLGAAGAQGSANSDFMDFLYYGQSVLSMGDEDQSGNSMVRDFSGPEEGYEMIKSYVDLLCNEYDFELTTAPYYQDGFFDFVLTYKGRKPGMTGSNTGTFSKATGNLMIYGTIKRERLEGALWYDYTLTDGDDGFRYGQTGKADIEIGASLREGLNRSGNTYETTDGRLSAKVGEAMVLTDGAAQTCSANYIIRKDDRQLRVEVVGKNANDVLCMYIPNSENWIDGIYSTEKFVIDADYAVRDRGVSGTMPSYTWETMFATAHGSDFVYPVRGMAGEMRALSIRVMYQEDETLVLYVCAGFNTAPYEVEALIAVDTNVTPTSGGNSGGGSVDVPDVDIGGGGLKTSCVFCRGGEVDCTNCNGAGGKMVTDNSIPNYSGSTSGPKTATHWETCFKCRGSGKQTCTHCGGTG